MKGSYGNDSQEQVVETISDDHLCQAGMKNFPPEHDFGSPLIRKPKQFLISKHKAQVWWLYTLLNRSSETRHTVEASSFNRISNINQSVTYNQLHS